MTSTLTLRRICPEDAERLVRFHRRLSDRTVYRRYHGPHPRLTEREIRYLVTADGHDHLAWVACDDDGEIIGVARVIRMVKDPSIAEVGIVVADSEQHHGIGHQLVERVLEDAMAADIHTIKALVLAGNAPARHLFLNVAQRMGIRCTSRLSGGVDELSLELDHPI